MSALRGAHVPGRTGPCGSFGRTIPGGTAGRGAALERRPRSGWPAGAPPHARARVRLAQATEQR